MRIIPAIAGIKQAPYRETADSSAVSYLVSAMFGRHDAIGTELSNEMRRTSTARSQDHRRNGCFFRYESMRPRMDRARSALSNSIASRCADSACWTASANSPVSA